MGVHESYGPRKDGSLRRGDTVGPIIRLSYTVPQLPITNYGLKRSTVQYR